MLRVAGTRITMRRDSKAIVGTSIFGKHESCAVGVVVNGLRTPASLASTSLVL